MGLDHKSAKKVVSESEGRRGALPEKLRIKAMDGYFNKLLTPHQKNAANNRDETRGPSGAAYGRQQKKRRKEKGQIVLKQEGKKKRRIWRASNCQHPHMMCLLKKSTDLC